MKSTSPCNRLGAASVIYDGVFYGDFNQTSSATAPATGGNFTQLYPPYDSSRLYYPYTANCVTPGGNIQCYSESPYAFHDMRRMIFTGSLFTRPWVIDAWGADTPNGCQTNFNDEQVEALFSVDFTSSAYPMGVVGMTKVSDYNVIGSPMCGQILSTSNNPFQCGITYGYFGGCSHLSIDEPTAELTCLAQTNVPVSPTNLSGSQTMVRSLATTSSAFLDILHPGVFATGAVQIGSGTTVSSKAQP